MIHTLVIGLDACDPGICRDLIGQGKMPVLASMMAGGAWAETTLPDGLFVGTVWPVLTRSVHSAATGRHSWIHVDPQSYELVAPDKRTLGGTPFWVPCRQAGNSVLLIDVPHGYATDGCGKPGGTLTSVCEWGAHDHHVGFETTPSNLAEEILSRYGRHPLLGTFPGNDQMLYAPDDYLLRAGPLRTSEEDIALSALVEPGIRAKTLMSCELAGSVDADLTMVVFGESHAVGHQLWHVHDRSHPRHDPAVAGVIGSPIERTYTALDTAVGELIASLDPINTAVVLSHGMGPHYDGTHLLEPVLWRLDQLFKRTVNKGNLGSRFKRAALETARALRHGRLHSEEPSGELIDDPEIGAAVRRQRHFFRSWNNDCVGAVRINLVGRESHGMVPAADLDGVLSWLENHLKTLINVDTGRPVVRRLYRTEAILEGGLTIAKADAVLPDLFIEWNRDAPIERVWSSSTGVIHHPVSIWRTGDHRQRGAVLVAGPSVLSGEHPTLPATWIAPTLAKLLGVTIDHPLGRPAEWLS